MAVVIIASGCALHAGLMLDSDGDGALPVRYRIVAAMLRAIWTIAGWAA